MDILRPGYVVLKRMQNLQLNSCMVVVMNCFLPQNSQKWDSNPCSRLWTRSWVWRLRPLGHPDMKILVTLFFKYFLVLRYIVENYFDIVKLYFNCLGASCVLIRIVDLIELLFSLYTLNKFSSMRDGGGFKLFPPIIHNINESALLFLYPYNASSTP